ncbi:MAG: hypothetical protein QXR06_00155 [Candidatus Bathyarchaeia archaeon]|nr:hypothetical protein [Candidatus Bathyarchaeota archaeon]
MVLPKTVEHLDFELASLKKRRDTLLALFNDGKISSDTAILLSKRFDEVETAINRLKQSLTEEGDFWMQIRLEGIKILESFLIEFRLLNLMGEMNEERWRDLSEAISSGLNALKNESSARSSEKSANQFLNQKNLTYPSKVSVNATKNKGRSKSGRESNNDSPSPSKMESSALHCMNPWKPNCKRTDIELSIYYNGRFVPICHECWKEISEKDMEWSNL